MSTRLGFRLVEDFGVRKSVEGVLIAENGLTDAVLAVQSVAVLQKFVQ